MSLTLSWSPKHEHDKGDPVTAPTDWSEWCHEGLDSKEYYDRHDAVLCLMIQRAAGPATVEGLIRRLSDTGEYIAEIACEALARTGPAGKKALPHIRRLLRHKDSEVREAAVRALGRLGGSVDEIARLVDDRDEMVAMVAARTLGDRGVAASPALPRLLRAMKRERRPTFFTYAIAQAIVRIDSSCPEFPPLARNAMKRTRSSLVRDVLMIPCGTAGATEMIPYVISKLDAEDQRLSALEALREYGPTARSAATALLKYVKSEKLSQRLLALEALWRVTGEAEPALSGLIAMLDAEVPPEKREKAAEVIGSMGKKAKRGVPALEAMQRDGLHRIREAARQALAKGNVAFSGHLGSFYPHVGMSRRCA